MIVKDRDGWATEVSGRCECCTKTQELKEVKQWSQEKLAANWDHCFLTPDMMKKSLRPNVVYSHKGQPKFLLLRNCISNDVYKKSLRALMGEPGKQEPLKFNKAKDTDRDAVRQLAGGEALLGWFAKYSPNDRITKITRNHWPTYVQFWDLLKEMTDLLEFHMPDYYKFHHKMAATLIRPPAPEDEESEGAVAFDNDGEPIIHAPAPIAIENGLNNGDFKYSYKTDYKDDITGTLAFTPDYTIGVSDFSTIQVNKSIVFTAHQDGNNVANTLGCITTFGEFAGGPLVFPRFGVGAYVGARDMLVCDSNSEYHGNLGPIVGTRFSVVAFLHNTLQSGEARRKAKQARKESRRLVNVGS